MIAEKGEKSYRQLFKNEKIANSNKTVLYALKRLNYMELLDGELGDNEGHRPSGRKSTYYNLTSDGLILALYYLQKLDKYKFIESLDKISTKQRKLLPFIFGKWSFYERNNLKDVTIARLYAVIKTEGADLEKFVEFRRHSMELELKQKDQFQKNLEHLKKSLVGSELKNFPHNPVFMSDKEKEKHLRALFKVQREIFQELGNPAWKDFGNSEVDRLLEAGKIIDEGAEKITIENVTDAFFFGSKRIRIKLENQADFLKIIVKDIDLRKLAKEYYQNEEKHQKKRYEDTLYLKYLSETN